MKQQKPPEKIPKVQPDWPTHPQSPQLKTIGGEADHNAIQGHNDQMQTWYFDFRTKINAQFDDLSSQIRNLEQRVAALEKAAIP